MPQWPSRAPLTRTIGARNNGHKVYAHLQRTRKLRNWKIARPSVYDWYNRTRGRLPRRVINQGVARGYGWPECLAEVIGTSRPRRRCHGYADRSEPLEV